MRRRFKIGGLLSSLTIVTLVASGTPALAQPGPPVVGSIRAEYDSAGGYAAFGNALAGERDDRQGGKFQDFQFNNHIYWNQRVDPNRGRQIGGAIFDKWATTDWENGYLGYPVSREFQANRGARGNHFENGGEIYWTETFGARIVVGEIGETWKASGYENGPYGVPTSDEYDFDGGKRQDFEFGRYITWKPTFAEDVENENAIPDSTCVADAACGDDDRAATIGLYNFDTNQNGQRRAGPENVDPEVQQLESSAPTEAAEKLESELGTVAEQCDLDAVPTLDAEEPGTGVCYVFGDENAWDIELTPPPTDTTAPSTEPSTTTEAPPSTPAPSNTTGSETTNETTAPTTSSALPTSAAPAPGEPIEPVPATCLTPTSTTTTTTTAAPTTTPQPSGTPACPPDAADPAEESTESTTTGAPDEPFGFAPRPLRAAQVPFKHTQCIDEDPNDGIIAWRGERDYACQERQVTMIHYQDTTINGVPTRIPIGTIGIRERQDVFTYYNSNQWEQRYSVYTAGATGTGVGAFLTGSASCISLVVCATSGTRTLTSQKVGVQPGSVDKLINWTQTLNWPSGQRPSAIGGFTLSAAFADTTKPGGIQRETAPPMQAPRVRCDNDPFMRGRVGCAFPAAPPVLDYTSKSNVASFTRHVKLAQESGLPGKPGQVLLNRIYNINRAVDPNAIDANRRASCGGITGPRSGQSCDEYPFASSNQGPRPSGPNTSGPARTFAGCGDIKDDKAKIGNTGPGGYSVCLIPQSENSRAGSFLSWFYTKNRIIEGDGFYIGAGAGS